MRIIVAKEKHGTRYLDASTEEQWAKNALKLLTERWNEGYWYLTPEEMYSDEDLETADMSDGFIAGLPTERLRENTLQLRKRAQRKLLDKKKYEQWWNYSKGVVERQDAVIEGEEPNDIGGKLAVGMRLRWGREPRAWRALVWRSQNDYEYEHVELVELES